MARLLKDLVPTTSASAMTASDLLASAAGSDDPADAHPTVEGKHRITPAYRTEVVYRILGMTSADTYVNITDFEWYTTVLVDLAYVSHVAVGEEIKDRILDVVARVRGNFRPFVVRLMTRLLRDEMFVAGAREEGSCGEVLYAASWVVGEYCQYVQSVRGVCVVADGIAKPVDGFEKGHDRYIAQSGAVRDQQRDFGRYVDGCRQGVRLLYGGSRRGLDP